MAAIIQKIENTLHKGGGDPKKAEERRRAAEAAKHKKEMERLKRGEGGTGRIVEKIKAKLHGGEREHYDEKKGGMGGGVVVERIHGGAGQRYGPMKQKEKL